MEKALTETLYSQQTEQTVILAAVGLRVGRFLDIGAWNPTDKSNTRALFERGWSGVMMEPSPGPLKNLLLEYGYQSRVQIVSAAAAVTNEGVIRMRVSDDAVSTTEEAEYNKWKEKTPFLGTLVVPVLSVRDIILSFGAFEFISIDTEGTSVDLFREFLRLRQVPACYCVEYNNRKTEAIAAASAAGYNVALENDTNLVFARREV
jgi:FkbM family methyltransferase